MRWRRSIIIAALLMVVGIVVYVWRQQEREQKFFPQIQAAAKRYEMDPLLVKAIVWRESRFEPNIRGRAGEIGLMQIRDVAAQEWADAERNRTFDHEHCLDPGTNTLAGTYYLAKLMKRYTHTDNPIPYALADYNAGRGNVLKWNTGAAATNSAVFIEQIGFPGTKNYVKTVTRKYAWYRFLLRLGWS